MIQSSIGFFLQNINELKKKLLKRFWKIFNFFQPIY